MFLKPLILVDRTFYLDSYHVPYGIWCYIMPLFSYFNLIFYRKVLNINHFSIFSMVWMFFICLFRFFFLRLETYAKYVFNICLDQGKSKFVMWKPNQVNFLETVGSWEQNRCDFCSKSRAVNQKLGSSWIIYRKLDFCSPFKKLTQKNSIKSSVKWVKRSTLVTLLQSRKVLNIKHFSGQIVS